MEIPAPQQGPSVRLRAFEAADLPQVMAWRADYEIRDAAMWDTKPFDRAAAERWLRVVSPPGSNGRITFAIEVRAGRRLVGQTNLTQIDYVEGTAYFGIVVGERTSWGQGIGRETLGLMLEYARALGLCRLFLDVASTNHRAIDLYRQAGFEEVEDPRQPPDGRCPMSDRVLRMTRAVEP